MSRLADFFTTGGTYEHSPMMHVQERKATGVDGGPSVVGDNDRVMTDVVTNNIPGASLAGGSISVSAGTYFISGSGNIHMSSPNSSRAVIKVNGVAVVWGVSAQTTYDGTVGVESEIIIPTGSNITLTIAAHDGASDGLGAAMGDAPYEVYADLRIWQLDAIKTSPIVHDSKLYPLPGNTYVTGDMYGLEYSYTGAHVVTVNAGICYDSLNATVLTGSTTQTVTIPSAINTIYNLFLCDDGVVRTDTDVDGANITEKKRWIGFVLTDAGGEICHFSMQGDDYSYSLASDSVIATGIGTTPIVADFSVVMPESRVSKVLIGCAKAGGTDSRLLGGLNSTNPSFAIRRSNTPSATADQWAGTGANMLNYRAAIPFNGTVYLWADIAGAEANLQTATLKR